jgi:hypothetical protein
VLFAHRTKQRIRVALTVCAVYALLVAAVAAVFPHEGKSFASSFGWWLLAVPFGLVAYAALELFGTWSLSLPFWQRMPSWARVFLLSQYVGGSRAL